MMNDLIKSLEIKMTGKEINPNLSLSESSTSSEEE